MGDRAVACEAMFARNDWPHSWRNGIHPYHHYHTTAHEVLGSRAAAPACGSAAGRPNCRAARRRCRRDPGRGRAQARGASGDLLVIGSYPRGQNPDMCHAKPDRHDRAAANIAAVPLPATDPVTGTATPLLDHWTFKLLDKAKSQGIGTRGHPHRTTIRIEGISANEQRDRISDEFGNETPPHLRARCRPILLLHQVIANVPWALGMQ